MRKRATRIATYGGFMPIKRLSTPDEQGAAIVARMRWLPLSAM
jgi:hypothetical protein